MNTVARKIIVLIVAAAATLTAVGCAANLLITSEFEQAAPTVAGPSGIWENSRDAETGGTDLYTSDWASGSETLVAGGNGDHVIIEGLGVVGRGVLAAAIAVVDERDG